MSTYQIKSRIWIEVDDKVFIGEGRVRLLKAIAQEGSLSKAAKTLSMSYKKAWKLIDSVNKSSQKQVVLTSVGGESGGGTTLTPYGQELIAAFDSINHNCWSFLDNEIKILDNL